MEKKSIYYLGSNTVGIKQCFYLVPFFSRDKCTKAYDKGSKQSGNYASKTLDTRDTKQITSEIKGDKQLRHRCNKTFTQSYNEEIKTIKEKGRVQRSGVGEEGDFGNEVQEQKQDGSFQCEICEDLFTSSEQRRRHIISVHNRDADKEYENTGHDKAKGKGKGKGKGKSSKHKSTGKGSQGKGKDKGKYRGDTVDDGHDTSLSTEY